MRATHGSQLDANLTSIKATTTSERYECKTWLLWIIHERRIAAPIVFHILNVYLRATICSTEASTETNDSSEDNVKIDSQSIPVDGPWGCFSTLLITPADINRKIIVKLFLWIASFVENFEDANILRNARGIKYCNTYNIINILIEINTRNA